MLLEASLITFFLILSAAATGYIFSGWFKRFRIIPVCASSIVFTISLVVVVALDMNNIIIMSAIALQVISLGMMIATGSAKLRHKLHVLSQAA